MNTPRARYSYVVLRYMHDVFTREFVNVGVLLHAPGARFIGFERLEALDRVRAMFPGLQTDSLRDLLSFLAARAEKLQRHGAEFPFSEEPPTAADVACTLLPPDDSALQWSVAGGGISADPRRTLGELFERLVTRHQKPHPATRRQDIDVWRPFERELRERHILPRLQERTLKVGELHHVFKGAWQPPGGHLRLYQPLSFDLTKPSAIVEKAVQWNGLVRQFRKVDPDFFIYLLVGKPEDQTRLKAFDQAYETLAEEDRHRQLVPESEAASFAEAVAREITASARN